MVESIYSKNLPPHENPIPHASKINGLIMSSSISGKSSHSRSYSPDKRKQIALAFKNFEVLLEECKLTPQDVLKVEMYFQNKKDRGIVNEFWEDLYQNESNRPSRHSHEASLPTGCIFQMTFVALKSS